MLQGLCFVGDTQYYKEIDVVVVVNTKPAVTWTRRNLLDQGSITPSNHLVEQFKSGVWSGVTGHREIHTCNVCM